jgi:acyl transferase domain-containing protein/acyl carrier protein
MIRESSRPEEIGIPIAVVGMSCRFPGGANSPEAYWRILESGTDVIREIPSSRWDVATYYDPDVTAPGKMCTRRGGFLDLPIDRFDAAFFNITPKEAMAMDPQQRFLLELSWEALEYAAIDPQSLRGSKAGVFIGVSSIEYDFVAVDRNIDRIDSYSTTGSCSSALAGRISFTLGLQGPSQAIDTACSSSLVSIDNACAYLRLGKADLALAGAFTLNLLPKGMIQMTKLQALSPDGVCRSFDAEAKGYVRSEGGGLVVLKRLDQALADGDPILGVIRGSAVNQDGESNGISAPNGDAQQQVIAAALHEAGWSEADLDYIETHGTGTRVGDQTEATALGELMRDRRPDGPLRIGSVKSNIGHLEAAAGMAGLIKVLLALKHEQIPANLHFHRPNPEIDWARYPLQVVDRAMSWPRSQRPRRAGVSAFGFVGTNAHLVIEEPPSTARLEGTAATAATEEAVVASTPTAGDPRSTQLLPLSARSEASLRQLAERYRDHIERSPETSLGDLCASAALGRSHFEYRLAVGGSSCGEMATGLAAQLDESEFERMSGPRKPVFLFTGQGAQYLGMGHQLYQSQPVFRDALDRCDRIFRAGEGHSLCEMLYGEDAESGRIDQTLNAQPLLFAVEVALCELWRSLGVEPAAVIGHSLGEYVAAWCAGVMSLEDALLLVTTRARLMYDVPGEGGMLSVLAPRQTVDALLGDYPGQLSLATCIGPENHVISGNLAALDKVAEQLAKLELRSHRLRVSHAFHSHQMEPALPAFAEAVARVTLRDPELPLISNLTGRPAESGQLCRPEYWTEHLRHTVQLQDSFAYLQQAGFDTFVEVGPAAVMRVMAQSNIDNPRAVFADTLRQRIPNWQTLCDAVSVLYRAGVEIDWQAWHGPYPGKRISLPTYAFGEHHFWVGGREAYLPPYGAPTVAEGEQAHPLLGQRIESATAPETTIFQTEIDRSRYHFFAEHRLFDVEIAPGAALLSLVWEAARQLFPQRALQFEEILFLHPLIVDQDRFTLQTLITRIDETQQRFEVVSRLTGQHDQPFTTHCTGLLCPGQSPPPRLPDLDQLRQRCDAQIDGEAFYGMMMDFGYDLGPSFRALRQGHSTPRETLCRVEFSPAKHSHGDFWLDPGRLDTLFQCNAVLLKRPDVLDFLPDIVAIPSHIDRIQIFDRPAAGSYQIYGVSSEGVRDNHKTYDEIYLVDEQNTLCVAINGFTDVLIPREQLLRQNRKGHLAKWLFEERWQPAPRTASTEATISEQRLVGTEDARTQQVGAEPPKRREWILFSDAHPLSETLTRALQHHGCEVTRVGLGAGPTSPIGAPNSSDAVRERQLDEMNSETATALLQSLGLSATSRTGLIYLPRDPQSTVATAGTASGPTRTAEGLQALLVLTQAFLALNSDGRLYALATEHHEVTPGTPLDFSSAGVAGFLAVAQVEHPDQRFTLLDLSAQPEAAEIDALADELCADDGELRVSLRGSQRSVCRFAQVDSAAERTAEFRPEPRGSYLVTGGLGGLGLKLAEELVARQAGRIVLAGRSAPSAEADRLLQRLRAAGAQISVVQADVSDAADCRRLLAEATRPDYPLRGLIHAAGVLADGMITAQSWDHFERALPAKVHGAFNLHQGTRGLDLDFFVLFSSVAATTGSLGQSNYAAANAFMNQLARHRRANGLCASSICWGPWAEVGMAAASEDRGQRMARDGVQSLQAEDGLTLLAQILEQELATPTVLVVDWPRFFKYVPRHLRQTYFQRIVGNGTGGTRGERTASSSGNGRTEPDLIARLRRADGEARRALVLDLVSRAAASVMGYDDDTQLPLDTSLIRMGFNSLMAVELRLLLTRKLSIRLPASLLYEHPTINALAELIDGQLQ